MDVLIFTHGDTDGLCAGAIAIAANPDAKVFFTNPYRLIEDLSVAKSLDTVIICDISLSENRLIQILERFSDIAKEGDLTYIDHHPLSETISKEDLPGRVIYDPASSTSELAYSFFQSKLDLMHSRIAIYGAIADYLDNTPLIQELLKRGDKRTLYFETGILFQGVESLETDYEAKRRVLSNLAKNVPPSLDEDLVRRAIEYTRREWEAIREVRDQIRVEGRIAYTLNFPFSLGKTATYIRGLTNVVIGIAGERRKDNKIDMSLRTCDEGIDLNKLLRKIAPELGGSGGGHPMAAGARIPEKNFDKLIKELNEKISLIDT